MKFYVMLNHEKNITHLIHNAIKLLGEYLLDKKYDGEYCDI